MTDDVKAGLREWLKEARSPVAQGSGALFAMEQRRNLAVGVARRLLIEVAELRADRERLLADVTRQAAEVAELIAERDRLREELKMARASERAALAAEAGRATPVVADWESLRQAAAERDTLAAQLARAETVIEKAAAVNEAEQHQGRYSAAEHWDRHLALVAAVDAYQATPTTRAWQPGDPVHPPQPAWLTCACGTRYGIGVDDGDG